MSDKPQVPTSDDIIAPAINKLVAIKPLTLKHINYGAGVWSHPFRGLRNQAIQMIRRNAQAVVTNRLPLATGAELLALVDSEFFTTIDPAPTSAIGFFILTRTGAFPAGTIPKGTRFNRAAVTSGPVTYPAAQYESLEDVFCRSGSNGAFVVRVKASQTGIGGNLAFNNGVAYPVTIVSPLFDPLLTVIATNYSLAGGSDGVTDDDARAIASAAVEGQYGPTRSAITAGCFLHGAKHIAFADDPVRGWEYIWIADKSWAASDSWLTTIYNNLRDDGTIGFGCIPKFNGPTNQFISAVLTVTLRDSNDLVDTIDVRRAIELAVRSYFDDRADWYTWSIVGVQTAVARAHRKILTCQSATIKDFYTDATLTQPTTTAIDFTQPQKHMFLANNSITASFVGPT